MGGGELQTGIVVNSGTDAVRILSRDNKMPPTPHNRGLFTHPSQAGGREEAQHRRACGQCGEEWVHAVCGSLWILEQGCILKGETQGPLSHKCKLTPNTWGRVLAKSVCP